MKRPLGSGTAFLLLGGAVSAIFAYNAWSISCGRCCLQNLLSPGPAGFGLLGLTFVAAVTLLLLRRRRQEEKSRQCRCGCRMAAGWRFCPDCGTPFPP